MKMNIPKIEQYLPILLLIIFLLFPSTFILQSNTILGKLISILLIVIYTNVHVLYGISVCLFVIFYYQSDYIYSIIQSENFQPKDTKENFKPKEKDTTENFKPKEKATIENMIPQRNPVYTDSSLGEYKINSDKIDELLLDFKKAYSGEKLPIQSESETIFRKQKCNDKLELVYKNKIIRNNDMIPYIFSELQFENDTPCNPCDPACPFAIKSSLGKKELIGQSTRGKTSLEEAMDWAYSFFVNKNEPFSGVDMNVASYL
jgi:hypothetical protein